MPSTQINHLAAAERAADMRRAAERHRRAKAIDTTGRRRPAKRFARRAPAQPATS
jgi:hypothetical protein